MEGLTFSEPVIAPNEIHYVDGTLEIIIGIGKEHTASLFLSKEAYEKLKYFISGQESTGHLLLEEKNQTE